MTDSSLRALPDGPGSRPSDGDASSGVSTVPAWIPNAGDFPELELNSGDRATEPFYASLKALWRGIQDDGGCVEFECATFGSPHCHCDERLWLIVRNGLMYERQYEALASGIEARRAATPQSGAVHESPVGEAETPIIGQRENPNG